MYSIEVRDKWYEHDAAPVAESERCNSPDGSCHSSKTSKYDSH